MGRLLPPGAVVLVPGSVSEPEFPLPDYTFEAVAAPMPKDSLQMGDMVRPLPLWREEVLFLKAPVLLLVALPHDEVELHLQ